jgi:CheY-like chemotaxis protein
MDYSDKTGNMKDAILKGCKILIVEDDMSSRLYLNKILEKTGAIIFNAGDGEMALNIVKQQPDIDVVLMDIQLPVMDGYQSAKKIWEIKEDMVIIAQTAYGLISDTEKIISAGFNDYIIKPIMSRSLIDKIIACIKAGK